MNLYRMNNTTSSLNGTGSPLIQETSEVSLLDLLDNLFYYRWHFFVAFVLSTSIAALYAIISTPIYTADALIQVEEKKGTSLGALSQVATALGAQQSPILGEIEILRSRSIVGKAVDNLKANVEITVGNRIPIFGNWLSRILPRDKDGLTIPLWDGVRFSWGGEQLILDEIVVPPTMLGKPLMLEIGANNNWVLLDNEGRRLAVGQGVERSDGDSGSEVRLNIRKLIARTGTRFRIVVFSIQSRVSQVLSSFNVIEAKRQSNILKLTYESGNAAFAASMLNAIANVYLQQNVGRRSEEAELSLNFLNEELPKLRVRLDASEKALNDFRSKTKTIDVSAEIKELVTKTTMLEKTQLELDLKQRELAEKYDSSHPLMKALQSQITGVKVEYSNLTRQIGQLPSIEQNYIRLARDVQVNNQLYVSLLNNAQQLQIAKAGTTGNVAIVDRAVVPEYPSRPRKLLIVIVGAIIGLVAGFLICQILSVLSKIVRDPKKLETELNLPILAILPLDVEQLEHVERGSSSVGSTFLLSKERPGASNVEALRSLRTSLLFKLSEKNRSKVVLITSAVPAQGKSFIAVNLGYLMAATGKKVLLIEADIRIASIKRYIDFDTQGAGLSTVLRGEVSFERAVRLDVFPNFDLLPSGPTVRDPGDLLAADSMHTLIDYVAQRYDFVVIDSPPLLPVHDARSLAKSADVSLFVVRQDAVNLTEVRDAIDVFNKSGNEIDGIVFNAFIPSGIRYGYGYGYGYKYRQRYRGYGRAAPYGPYGTYGTYGKSSDPKSV